MAPATEAGALDGFIPEAAPRPLPPLAFLDGEGRRVGLGDFSGAVVLLNLWATWCGPCVEEIPALDRLQARFGGHDFQVVAVSVDRGGEAVVKPFLARRGLDHLAPYLDPDSRLLRQLGVSGIPVSLLLDRSGRLLGRVEGDPDWDSAEARRLIEGAIAGGGSAPARPSGLIRTSG